MLNEKETKKDLNNIGGIIFSSCLIGVHEISSLYRCILITTN